MASKLSCGSGCNRCHCGASGFKNQSACTLMACPPSMMPSLDPQVAVITIGSPQARGAPPWQSSECRVRTDSLPKAMLATSPTCIYCKGSKSLLDPGQRWFQHVHLPLEWTEGRALGSLVCCEPGRGELHHVPLSHRGAPREEWHLLPWDPRLHMPYRFSTTSRMSRNRPPRLIFQASDGCNTCRCAASGLRNESHCTRRACPPQLPGVPRLKVPCFQVVHLRWMTSAFLTRCSQRAMA